MKRALLIFNPEATSVSPRVRNVIVRALASELELETAETKRRNHAVHLAQGGAHDSFDVIIALGGDGTLNEVINGVAGSKVPIVPLPGGNTNVFARTVGYPNDPIEATAVALERLAAGVEPRAINLGTVNGRAFACNAGIGYDAEIVRAVERRFRVKQHIGDAFFVYQAVRQFVLKHPRRDRLFKVETTDGDIEDVRTVFVCNSTPYTYWGDRALHVCPQASLDEDLDFTAFTRFGLGLVLRSAARAFGKGSHTGFRGVEARHDIERFTVTSERPLAYQVDGDYAGEESRFEFASARDAVRIIA